MILKVPSNPSHSVILHKIFPEEKEGREYKTDDLLM